MSDDDIHFIDDLEERENASMVGVTTLALGEESGECTVAELPWGDSYCYGGPW